MSAVSEASLAVAASDSAVAFALANAYAACLFSLPGPVAGNLALALEKLPAFVAVHGFLHGGAAPLASGLVAACGVWAIWAYSLTHGRAERAGEEHGSARWASPRETRKFADTKNPENNVILSRDVRMALDARAANVGSLWQRNLNHAVVGGSGSGKTFFDLLPNIMQANASYFVTDPKGQTLPMADGLLEERGYRVLAFDTIDFSKSLHYNPIAYVEDEADILELVGCLIANTSGDDRHAADPFWENAERLLYVALIGYLVKHCPHEDRSLSGVVTLLSLERAKETDEDYVSPLDLLFLEVETGMRYVEVSASADVVAGPLSRTASAGNARFRWVRVADPVSVEDDFCLLHYKMFKDAAGRTAKSILVSCNTHMEPFAIPQVRELVSCDEMELDQLGDADCRRAVFATVSDTSGLYSFLLAIMMWQAVNVLCRRALSRYGGSLPTHVSFLLDEFANIERLPDIEKTIAVVRSRNVSVTVYLQSMSQLKSRSVEEQRCDSNAGLTLIPAFDVTDYRDSVKIDLGTIEDPAGPAVRTEATDADDGDHEAVADDTVTIVDTVSYTDLTPGKEYTLTGTLVDRETGEPVCSDGKAVTSTVAFVPGAADGAQEVTFTFDGAALSGHAVVAFESLTLDGQEVAAHADVNDEGQTVRLVPPETPETPTPSGKLPQTGDELPIAGICALAAAGCAATVIGIARSIGSRRREEDEGEEA